MASSETPDPEGFMTVREVARFFAMKDDTIRQWLYDETLPGIKINNQWRIKRADVLAYANSLYGKKS